MKHTPTISAKFEVYLKQNDMTLSQFAEYSGVHQRTLSNWITQHRPVSVQQLDRITVAMDLLEGYFYDLYIENYIIELSPNFRRIEPLLYRCAELDKLDAIRRMVGHIMDNPLYASRLFDIAEALFNQRRHAAALLLYEIVAEVEKYQHSERLAICQYRIFTIQVGDDQGLNLKAATLFEPFVERLDEIDQLDALKDLANVYRSLRLWDRLDVIARKMRDKAEIQYTLEHQQKKRNHAQLEKKLSRPLFVYITYADLLCASVYEAKGDYDQALEYTYAYANLDWVKETDENTLHWIKQFQDWAEGNTYTYKLLSGDISVLNNYVEYIAASPDASEKEMITKLLNIMMAANRYQVDVDDILKQFETEIDSITQQQLSADMYTYQVVPEQSTRFKYELAKYYLNKGNYSLGFKHLLDVLFKSLVINKEAFFISCIKLFEQFKQFADFRLCTRYESLIREGRKERLFYY
ncbi:DNA-binding protein [Paenibacillus polymyxa]|uniref:helix-turn-helix domain-containing protein n=2 Tax=Paenibacillus TaxID=44249 RepID=UPI00057813A6|nr:helix-turn-helix transcriptional regulator [Paenibacillus polymyxa]KJD41431.1 DNA-binding protein [Paenibacillus polymyxa]MBE3647194.1 helix-turn-helix transcriptional regulator [Paenibacillus polymyxa]RGL29278.1 XRE family transcriptional regulator [Paenibacillus polymyxa]UNL96614.1 XRE family transcriptional regulator [Paenibacillus polymyxa]UQQ37295.1 helix-turn-helix transcriptional regulator [Paenibacillus polymyxa]